MIINKMNMRQASIKSFSLKGGLNTEVANMERTPGELLICTNYQEVAGAYSGYQSVAGYERFDGHTRPSSIQPEVVSNWKDATSYVLYDRVRYGGYIYVCVQIHTSETGVKEPSGTTDDNTYWDYEAVDGEEDYYKGVKREAARTAILAVGANATPACYGPVRGVHILNDLVLAFRNDQETATKTKMFKSGSTGWVEVAADSAPNTMAKDSTIKAITTRFAEYPPASPNSEIMLWIDSVTAGFFVWTGTGTYTKVTHANLPVATAPIDIGVWENRLFLVYEGGHIFFSNVGDPSDFDSATGTAGEVFLGEDITGLIPTAGVLIIFTRRGTKILNYGSTSQEFIFKLDEYSKNIGALEGTVDSHYENIFFCSDRAVTMMSPSATSGGFATDTLSDKIAQNYLNVKEDITTTLIDNKNGRYYIFYTATNGNSHAYTFTMYKGKLKGVGAVRYLHKLVCSTQGVLNDGTDLIIAGGNDGYVYQLESGTSFDGEEIDCRMTTSFYHYGSPRNWKFFQRLTMEIYCPSTVEFSVAPVFDYGQPLLKKHSAEEQEILGVASVWGEGILWGSFVWGGGQLGKAVVYTHGHGQNMGVTIRTSSKWGSQYTIHNVTTDYQQESIRQ